MPKWILPTLLVLTAVALVPPAVITWARSSHSGTPRINLVPDMDYQPRFQPQTENGLFLDKRGMRPQVDGTIARGHLDENEAYTRGRANGDWVARVPVPVTESMVQRGRARFEIYCAPCHGISGFGDGMVARRADLLAETGNATWTPPTSIHDELVVGRADGHIFNTITYGVRTMPAYGPQISVADRWAIVTYVRALQRSQSASLSDVPEDVRPTLR
jgi:mono/diheme cytochrome c family protein